MLNEVFGGNITLRELHSFFFDTLGMLPITYYGARGDGRTDNYGNLQVAIDDANRRGLRYLYVPFGRYLYRGELINRDNIAFVGNPKAEIINSRTGESIPIHQFGVCEYGCLKYGNCGGEGSTGGDSGNMPNPDYSDMIQANNGEAYFDSLEKWLGYPGYVVSLFNSSKISLGDTFNTIRLPYVFTTYTFDTVQSAVERVEFNDGSYIEGTFNEIIFVSPTLGTQVLYEKNSQGLFERVVRNDYIYDVAFRLTSNSDTMLTVTSMPSTTYFIENIKKAIYIGSYIWTSSGWALQEELNYAVENGSYFDNQLDSLLGTDGMRVNNFLTSPIAVGNTIMYLRLPNKFTYYTLDIDNENTYEEKITFSDGSYIRATTSVIQMRDVTTNTTTVLYNGTTRANGIEELFRLPTLRLEVSTISDSTVILENILKAEWDGAYEYTDGTWNKMATPNPGWDDVVNPFE